MRRVALACGVAVVTLFSSLCPRLAHATDTQACLAASEKAQRSRAAGKLREAQKQLVICAADGCPGLVRRDCSQWQGELASLTPSVVFGAKDRTGRDLFDVTVTMDGEPLVKSLDGKSVNVDPGPHLFLFETPGQPGVTERVLVKEGEKARAINIVIGVEPPATKPVSGGTTKPPEAPGGAPSGEVREHTIPPWIVVGVGGAAVVTGVVVFASAPSFPASCSSVSQVCTKGASGSDAQLAKDRDDAEQHDVRQKVGLIIGGIGLAAVAGGLLWHFLEPVGPKDRAKLQLAPWKTADGSGLTLLGSF